MHMINATITLGCYIISPISIDILPMRRLWKWHLLMGFHVPVRCTICMVHWVNHLAANLLTADLLTTKMWTTKLLTTDLLAEIHRLIDQPLVLESRVDLALLEPYSLMILLGHLWKNLLPRPSTISIHLHRTCR